ncbi:MAG: hypothetical protein H6670_11720 [Anaerolineaceae bacterium]|nr:hypothetical protein [Anaerolineaceae bacterium]
MQTTHPLFIPLSIFSLLAFGFFAWIFVRSLIENLQIRRKLLRHYKEELKNGFKYTGKAFVGDAPAVHTSVHDYEDKLNDLGYHFVGVIEEHNKDSISWIFVNQSELPTIVASITFVSDLGITGVTFRSEFADGFIVVSMLGSKNLEKEDLLFQSIPTSLDATHFAHLSAMKDLSKTHGPTNSFETMTEIIAFDKRDTESNSDFVVRDALRTNAYGIAVPILAMIGISATLVWPLPLILDRTDLSPILIATALTAFVLINFVVRRGNLLEQESFTQKKRTT